MIELLILFGVIGISVMAGLAYKPILEGLIDFDKIGPKSAGYSVLKGRSHLKYGFAGLAGAHENGNFNFTPSIGFNVKRSGYDFDLTCFSQQYPTANSAGRDWEIGHTPEKSKNPLDNYKAYGMKPQFENLLEALDSIIITPNAKLSSSEVRSILMRSEDDLKQFAKTTLLQSTLMTSFLAFPNLTSQSFDTYLCPTFTKKNLPLVIRMSDFSQDFQIEGVDGAGKATSSKAKINGTITLDVMEDVPKLERFLAPYRQQKGLWNFVEDLFSINRKYAPLDILYMWHEFESAKRDLSQFAFDQILQFDQKPIVGDIEFKFWCAMQFYRMAAFNYCTSRLNTLDAWVRNIKAHIKAPMYTQAEFENVFATLEKFWKVGTFQRVAAAGEGMYELNVLPIGDNINKIAGYSVPVPQLSISEVPTPLQTSDFNNAQQLPDQQFVVTPCINYDSKGGRVLTWDRLTGIDGLDTNDYCAIALNLITPSSVKKIMPKFKMNDGSLDRINPDLYPILVQLKNESLGDLASLIYGDKYDSERLSSNEGSVAKYALGLVSIFKGPLVSFDTYDVATQGQVFGTDGSPIDRFSLFRPNLTEKDEKDLAS